MPAMKHSINAAPAAVFVLLALFGALGSAQDATFVLPQTTLFDAAAHARGLTAAFPPPAPRGTCTCTCAGGTVPAPPPTVATTPAPPVAAKSPPPPTTVANPPTPTATPPPPSKFDLGTVYTGGFATWYGYPAAPTCLSQYAYPGYKTVAMNRPQYGQGEQCGACVNACFTPPSWWVQQNGPLPGGQQCINAVVNNLCPGCAENSMDLGYTGNGRWNLTWSYIPCPTAQLVGRVIASNPWYGKLKFEGVGRIVSVTCNGYAWKLTYDGCWSTPQVFGPRLDGGVTCVVDPEVGAPISYTFGGWQFKASTGRRLLR